MQPDIKRILYATDLPPNSTYVLRGSSQPVLVVPLPNAGKKPAQKKEDI